jgi:hypothetical protein
LSTLLTSYVNNHLTQHLQDALAPELFTQSLEQWDKQTRFNFPAHQNTDAV